MFYKKFVYSFLAMLIVVAFFSSLTMPAGAAFDPKNPKDWAIADYQVKQSLPKYTPKDASSVQRNKDVESSLRSLLLLSHTASDPRFSENLADFGKKQVKSIDSANKALDDSTKRTGAKKFFLGPDYTTLKTVKAAIKNNESIIASYKTTSTQINSIPARITINQSVKSLEKNNTDLKASLEKADSGFSLFGWLIRPLKYK